MTLTNTTNDDTGFYNCSGNSEQEDRYVYVSSRIIFSKKLLTFQLIANNFRFALRYRKSFIDEKPKLHFSAFQFNRLHKRFDFYPFHYNPSQRHHLHLQANERNRRRTTKGIPQGISQKLHKRKDFILEYKKMK
jgi:hypothetical protein